MDIFEMADIDRLDDTNIAVPNNIVIDMVDLLDEAGAIRLDWRYLNLGCTSGRFILEIKKRLMKLIDVDYRYKDKTPEEKEKHVNNQLYAICFNPVSALITRKAVFGNCLYGDNQILVADVKEEIKQMQFNVVIGNPPYNKGMDLDFIKMGFDISTQYCCMITPAKWQTAADDYIGCASNSINYKEFRDKLVSHMRHVTFYPCCKDVFDILQVDGISYFLMDTKNKYDECIVCNKSTYFPELNSTQKRSILNRETLLNVGNELIEYLGDYVKFEFPHITGNKKYQVWTNNKTPGGSLSTVTYRRKSMFIGESCIEDGSVSKKGHTGAQTLVFESDNWVECICFMSWLGCSFNQFFCLMNQSKLSGVLTDDCFRFVPAPPAIQRNSGENPWNSTYNDDMLYEYFNIPQKYIDIIESMVKTREVGKEISIDEFENGRRKVPIYFFPIDSSKYDLFQLSVGDTETFLATQDMTPNSVAVFRLANKNGIDGGIHAVGIIESLPYVCNNTSDKFCYNKLSVNIKIIKIERTAIIPDAEYVDIHGQIWSTHRITGIDRDRLQSALEPRLADSENNNI